MPVYKDWRRKFRIYSLYLKFRKIIEIIDFFFKKKELTGSVPSERTVPSLNRSRDKEFSLQVSDPGQKERDIFLHTP